MKVFEKKINFYQKNFKVYPVKYLKNSIHNILIIVNEDISRRRYQCER